MGEAIDFKAYDADQLGRGLSAVAPARGSISSSYSLYRSTYMEFFHDMGVRLTCTDGGMLLTTFVPMRGVDLTREPGMTKIADQALLALDLDNRMLALAKHAAKLTDEDEDHQLRVKTAKSLHVDGQLDGMEQRVVRFDLDHGTETVSLPIGDGFPRWQHMWSSGWRNTPTRWMKMSAQTMKRIGDAANAIGGTAEIHFGKSALARIIVKNAITDQVVRGLFMGEVEGDDE